MNRNVIQWGENKKETCTGFFVVGLVAVVWQAGWLMGWDFLQNRISAKNLTFDFNKHLTDHFRLR